MIFEAGMSKDLKKPQCSCKQQSYAAGAMSVLTSIEGARLVSAVILNAGSTQKISPLVNRI